MGLESIAAASKTASAGHMLERAGWAARAFGDYSQRDVERIVRAVADVAFANSRRFAEAAVAETTFGVVEHKLQKNEACSRGLLEAYAGTDFVSPRIDADAKIIEVPRPAGVILAITPSTNPVASVYFKVLLALMTRNAVVVSPHPMAKKCCVEAAELLAEAAVAAGAPDGVIQAVAEPTIPLVESMMADRRTNLIIATGGSGVVRAAYSSGNPAMGVGPGNVPVFVDHSADIRAAARRIVDSKAFDNSVLCTNESVLIVEESVSDSLIREMRNAGAVLLNRQETQQLRDYMFPSGQLNTAVVGKDAAVIAAGAGVRVGPRTKVLLAPFDVAVPDEPLTHEKLSPVLGLITARDRAQGIATARAIVRGVGAGHSAAIHSTDPETVMAFTARVPVLRVVVNVGNSTGSSGLGTNLPISMTIGTGFAGRSSLGENLKPDHLINCVRIAYNSDSAEVMPSYVNQDPTRNHTTPVPVYPVASNDPEAVAAHAVDQVSRRLAASSSATAFGVSTSGGADQGLVREEIRRLVAEELSQLIKG
ncbi:aldehyde dehydrogenase family protein [Gordonia phthalatica]|uniref:Aldehyde dehydrogenase n=1 Tax=Gordonia phthalatica TaxID=1136941 RepID=A0A0N9MV20_9ACTN|nr:aldehyde dehydrogenase family protein [Gordonia phthalatica]ALG86488.1 aldehyde dehydrogenase [Gordonia phthalatica]